MKSIVTTGSAFSRFGSRRCEAFSPPSAKWISRPNSATNFHSCQTWTSSGKRYYRSERNGSSNTQFTTKDIAISTFTALGAAAIGYAYLNWNNQNVVLAESDHDVSGKSLPEFTRTEVAKHKTKETGIWVTYKGGVYDITEFVANHPGGEKIFLAVGAAIDPFWAMYAVHNTPEVLEMLEEMRIGTLSKSDQLASVDPNDPYSTDPERHPALIVRTQKPFNAETPTAILSDNFYVPNELFFVRNHLPVPKVDPKNYVIEITGEGLQPMRLTLDDIKEKFHHKTVVAALQCSGNRRSELLSVKPVKGLEWGTNAIGNASWKGVSLRDILLAAGFQPNDKIAHVQFEGLDKDVTGVPYGSSIPIEKALGPYGDVILAFEMNGQELPLDHGYPVRIIAPGITGARNVKWLSKIITSSEESPSFWQQKDYKSFPPQVDWNNVDWSSAPAIQESPVTSAICEPLNGTTVPQGEDSITVKGYAWSGGGRGIIRVDVSIDGGKNWQTADLKNPTEQSKFYNRGWAWSQWQTQMKIPQDCNPCQLDIVCKAVDSSYNVQPESLAPIWNLRGVLTNAWHHVKVQVPGGPDARSASK
eukprot:TRINITY_DN4743_c0_g1_i1.p1 TRINITY_DN4743_c0_g1~~TRINITY_DN4743_c0_g1_i1.p1  ORF type:complete len:587 (+),score=108.53 TRINITY_DN4743_c0_g1_i1:53-1813(+)